MDNDTITKALPEDAGCWIDGHWGQYGITRLIEIAQGNGWELTADEEAAVGAYLADEETFVTFENGVVQSHDTPDWILNQGGIGDAAEAWMNENIAPEGFSFGWHDGEFFLWSTETWEEAD